MLKYKSGNIFNSTCHALVNPVNCVGVMGAGLAKQYKAKFPKMFNDYENKCLKKQIEIGTISSFLENDKLIINFPTKDHWKNPSKLEYIEKGMKSLIHKIEELDIRSIAFPLLGCGLGGLNEDDVFLIMEKYLSPLSNDVFIEVYIL